MINTDFMKGVVVPILTPIDEDEKIDEKEYEILKSEAERYFKEVADLYKISGKREYSISKSFIKNYCSKARE